MKTAILLLLFTTPLLAADPQDHRDLPYAEPQNVSAKVVAAEGKTHGTINSDLGLPDDKPNAADFEFLENAMASRILDVESSAESKTVSAEAKRPNVVLIMTDNQGAWTLGCYGNPDIRTPHIDRLAAEGIRFTRAFSSNPVCSPTRATFLTGLLPSQHGVHCFLRADEWQMGEGARCVIDEFRTLPEILAEAGYVCGLAGKWHLGANATPHRGFSYWVTTPHGGTQTFYDAPVIEDGQQRREPEYLTDFWTRHAIKFIEQQKDDERPFTK